MVRKLLFTTRASSTVLMLPGFCLTVAPQSTKRMLGPIMLFTSLVCVTTPHFCLTVGVRETTGRAKDLPAPPRGARWKRVMAASAGGVPEQLEQVRVAQVTHPAASSSAHEVPDNRHGARRAAGPCEVEWRRAWSSSATSPSRLGQSVLSVLHPRQFEGRCFAVRHPDPKCAHASAAPAASCARVSITHVGACLRPPACVAVGRGTPKHLHGCARDERCRGGGSPLHTACLHNNVEIATLLLDRGADVD